VRLAWLRVLCGRGTLTYALSSGEGLSWVSSGAQALVYLLRVVSIRTGSSQNVVRK
jgi:hypothetical protein